MSPAFGELLGLAGFSEQGLAASPEVTSVEYDSRRSRPGSLFVAIPGFRVDGHRFAAAAVAAGAVAVVAERPPDPPMQPGTPLVLVANSRIALSRVAAILAGEPSRRLTVAGITGTDGKTTTTTMLWAAWRGSGQTAASLTTVDLRVADRVVDNPTRMTTLEAVELQARLAEFVAAGCSRAAVETSSHALHLHRVDDVDYDVAVYTQITAEHLDIHGSREEYVRTKMRLLEMVGRRDNGLAVLDADDAFAFPRLRRLPVAGRLTYSLGGDPGADLVAEDILVAANGVSFLARTPWGSVPLRLQMAGRFNAGNALAALAAACGTGAALEAAADGISSLESVAGRMERVDLGQDFAVVVDYAHTAAALDKVLAELRPATPGRLWAVFGSAGERDREKRPAMGAVAARGADVVVLTDEDPRTEASQAILEEIAAGAESSGAARGDRLHLIADRRAAIDFAIGSAAGGDTVLLAGKGHESSILTAAGSEPWNERGAAEAALRRRLGGMAASHHQG